MVRSEQRIFYEYAVNVIQGTSGFERHMDRLMELTEYMVRRIKEQSDKFHLILEPEMVNVSFWYLPRQLRGTPHDANKEIKLGKVGLSSWDIRSNKVLPYSYSRVPYETVCYGKYLFLPSSSYYCVPFHWFFNLYVIVTGVKALPFKFLSRFQTYSALRLTLHSKNLWFFRCVLSWKGAWCRRARSWWATSRTTGVPTSSATSSLQPQSPNEMSTSCLRSSTVSDTTSLSKLKQ